MKKTLQSFLGYILPMAFGGLLVTGCSTDTTIETIDLPSVAIEQTGDFNDKECSFVLTPSALTDHFEYAIGVEEDRSKFENGTLETIKKQAGKEKLTVVFDDLSPNKMYTVFARAYTAANFSGPTATCVPKMNKFGYTIEQKFLTDHSAGLAISCSSDFYRFRYALGTAADRAAFEDGTLETKNMEERTFYAVSFFDLKANTEYIFYSQGYERGGKKTAVIETPITTFQENGCPAVTMTIDKIDIYEGNYTFTPNALCGAAAVVICDKGQWADVIDNAMNWRGDIFAMLNSWYKDAPDMLTVFGEGPLPAVFQTPGLMLDHEMEAFVLIVDKEGNPSGVSHFEFQTPPEDPNAAVATATVIVSDITAAGATYTFTADDNTFAYMYDTVDADWYDAVKETPEYYEHYLADVFYSNGQYWHYTNSETTFTEGYGTPGTRYYAAVVPMNANGPAKGWGEAVLVEYTTLGEKPEPEPEPEPMPLRSK